MGIGLFAGRPLAWVLAIVWIGVVCPLRLPGEAAAGCAVASFAFAFVLSRLGRRTALLALSLGSFFLGLAVRPDDAMQSFPPEPIDESHEMMRVEALILDAESVSERSVRFHVQTEAIQYGTEETLRPWSERVAVYVAGDGLHRSISTCGSPGDRVRLWGKMRRSVVLPFPGGPIGIEGPLWRLSLASRHHCLVVRPAEVSGLVAIAERWRHSIHRSLRSHLETDEEGVVRALLTGDRRGISSSVNEDFSRSGLSHILAISGMNFSLVILSLYSALTWLAKQMPRLSERFGAPRLAAGICLPLVPAYALLTGASSPALRASVMLALFFIGVVLRRAVDTWTLFFGAAFALWLSSPAQPQQVSFQLSFAAVAGILLLYPALRLWASDRLLLRRWWRSPLELFLVGLSAQVSTLPHIVWYFGQIAFAGCVLTLPATVLVVGIIPVAALGSIMGCFGIVEGSRSVLTVAKWLTQGLVWLAEYGQPFSLELRPGSVLATGLAVLTSVILIWPFPGPTKRWPALIAFVGCIVLGRNVRSGPDGQLHAVFLPVGQGDAAVLRLPTGKVVLVDTGPPENADRVLLRYLRYEGIRHIDLLVLSHLHVDHAGGVAALMEHVAVDEIWWNGDARETHSDVVAALKRAGERVKQPKAGLRMLGGATVEVLDPVVDFSTTDPNNASLVIRVRIGSEGLLFGGDIEAARERALVSTASDQLQARLLKAPHHGSKTSSGVRFLRAVNPRFVLLPVGPGNRFGFPHPTVLKRLERRGAQVWRTDRDGAVRFSTDGHAWHITVGQDA
jgi:competence protein ComEC